MKISEEHSRFVPSAMLPQISGQSTIKEVFKQLGQRQTGGFLAQTDEGFGKYVKAKELAEIVMDMAKERGQRWVGAEPLSNLLQYPEVQSAIVQVDPRPIKSDEDSQNVETAVESVFFVQEGNSAIGWYFPQEELIKSLQTPPPSFECVNGHPNPDPDNGRCYDCSAEIKGLK